jgi:hypothetical protein
MRDEGIAEPSDAISPPRETSPALRVLDVQRFHVETFELLG